MSYNSRGKYSAAPQVRPMIIIILPLIFSVIGVSLTYYLPMIHHSHFLGALLPRNCLWLPQCRRVDVLLSCGHSQDDQGGSGSYPLEPSLRCKNVIRVIWSLTFNGKQWPGIKLKFKQHRRWRCCSSSWSRCGLLDWSVSCSWIGLYLVLGLVGILFWQKYSLPFP